MSAATPSCEPSTRWPCSTRSPPPESPSSSSFDGYGDSGQIENVEAKVGEDLVALPSGEVEIASAVWDQAEPERTAMTVHDAIERLVFDFLGMTHDGWENSDGAYGDFTFDVAERTITLDYNERYMQSEYSQHIF